MKNQHGDIDLVYMWVDGKDPKWKKKKLAFTTSLNDDSETNAIGRYINSNELKYSLRSVEKHAPWIRTIFIVTDDQKPDWLNTEHSKIKVIDHSEIIPSEAVPTFNSSVIEYFLHNIPGLSEHFLLANDDMFFNAAVSPDFFFAKDGYPYVRLKRKIFGKWHHMLKAKFQTLGHYRRMVIYSMNLVEQKFGKFYSGLPHHNIDSFRKSDYRKAVEEVFNEQVEKSKLHRTRTIGDLHRSAFSYYALAIGHAHIKYVGKKESGRILIYKQKFTEYINRYHPLLFCLNDDQHVTNEHRKQVEPFLESLFPVKSAFEK